MESCDRGLAPTSPCLELHRADTRGRGHAGGTFGALHTYLSANGNARGAVACINQCSQTRHHGRSGNHWSICSRMGHWAAGGQIRPRARRQSPQDGPTSRAGAAVMCQRHQREGSCSHLLGIGGGLFLRAPTSRPHAVARERGARCFVRHLSRRPAGVCPVVGCAQRTGQATVARQRRMAARYGLAVGVCPPPTPPEEHNLGDSGGQATATHSQRRQTSEGLSRCLLPARPRGRGPRAHAVSPLGR